MTKKDEKLYTSRPGRTYKPRDGQPAKTKTPTKRTRPGLNDFGKAVHHHLIDTGKSMADLEKAVGVAASSFRNAMHGDGKPPIGWVTNKKVPEFMRIAAAEAHHGEITANYNAMESLLKAEPAPTSGVLASINPTASG